MLRHTAGNSKGITPSRTSMQAKAHHKVLAGTWLIF